MPLLKSPSFPGRAVPSEGLHSSFIHLFTYKSGLNYIGFVSLGEEGSHATKINETFVSALQDLLGTEGRQTEISR